jgi:hypothetical protein
MKNAAMARHQSVDSPNGDQEHLTLADDPVSRMFEWWNCAFADNGFNRGLLAAHFTEDTLLIVNGARRAGGLDALAEHFSKIRGGLEFAAVRLPLLLCYRAGAGVLVHYIIDARNGERTRSEESIGHMRLSGDKIALIDIMAWEID